MARVYKEVQQPQLMSGMNLITRLVNIVGGLIVALLGLRFLLALLGANPNNSFASFIYSTSRPFAQPFFGLFNYKSQFGITRFEYETLIAIIFYALLIWLISLMFGVGDDY